MTLRQTTAADEEAVRTLAAASPWPSRRGLDRVSLDSPARLAATEATAPLRQGRPSFVIDEDGAVVGSVGLTRNSWECGQLGLEVGRVTAVVTTGSFSERLERSTHLLQAIASAGPELLVARIDVDDDATLAAAQGAGFAVHECAVGYLHDTADRRALDPPSGPAVSIHESGDLPTIDPGTRAAFRHKAEGFSWTHFGADPRLDRTRVAGLYRAWTDEVLDGNWGDWLLLAHHRGQIVGMMSITSDRDVISPSGAPMSIGTFALSLVPGVHVMRNLIRCTTDHDGFGADHCELVTTSRNVPTSRALQDRPSITMIRSSYTLHRWRDPSMPPRRDR